MIQAFVCEHCGFCCAIVFSSRDVGGMLLLYFLYFIIYVSFLHFYYILDTVLIYHLSVCARVTKLLVLIVE